MSTADTPNPEFINSPWRDPEQRPFIEIEGLSKRYDHFIAVDAVNLKIYRRELFTILGGSGCGKTTLLRMLAGFEKPSAGRIRIDGVDVTDLPPYERPVNMMFQSYAVFPHMTVYQNIAYGLKKQKLSRAYIEERVERMLELVQLTALSKRKPNQLSGGQRQRVALEWDDEVFLSWASDSVGAHRVNGIVHPGTGDVCGGESSLARPTSGCCCFSWRHLRLC